MKLRPQNLQLTAPMVGLFLAAGCSAPGGGDAPGAGGNPAGTGGSSAGMGGVAGGAADWAIAACDRAGPPLSVDAGASWAIQPTPASRLTAAATIPTRTRLPKKLMTSSYSSPGTYWEHFGSQKPRGAYPASE